jgi:hypothetical protein
VCIQKLERDTREIGGGGGEGAARAEGEEFRVVTRGDKRAGEEDRLALGATAAEVILDDENFHCAMQRRTNSERLR